MICEEEKDISSFDLRVMQVLSVLPLNEEQTLIRLNCGLDRPFNGLIVHSPGLNLHALQNKHVIGASNLQVEKIQNKKKNYNYQCGVIYEITENGVSISTAPVEKSAIGDRVYIFNDNIPEDFEKQTHLDWETIIKDIKFAGNVSYKNKELIIKDKDAIMSSTFPWILN